MSLDYIRKKVDALDAELLALLNRRMEMTIRTKNLKQQAEDAGREKEVMAHITSESRALVTTAFAQTLFREIMAESKRLQKEDRRLIGFQGEHGAYSEIASGIHDATAVAIPHREFVDIFEGVDAGILDYGVVPIENSLGGNVAQIDDLLIEHDLSIIAEVNVPISHCLITLPDTHYRDVRAVYSHPQALSQCRGFIARNQLEPRPYYDTAGSALMLAREKPKATAVIASALSAELYNLQILKEHIEDVHTNCTRFVVLAKEPTRDRGDKCSIIFSAVEDRPGTLFRLLSAFSEAEINLTRIESRPLRNGPGKYAFLVDFLGSEDEAHVKAALAKVRQEGALFKFLGCYRKADV
ncbi:MAG: prephenate dehydratase [Deltaproteobacteria bacterium]|nr:prephenate dehydratase [Deltaproteobacteria bacterium]